MIEELPPTIKEIAKNTDLMSVLNVPFDGFRVTEHSDFLKLSRRKYDIPCESSEQSDLPLPIVELATGVEMYSANVSYVQPPDCDIRRPVEGRTENYIKLESFDAAKRQAEKDSTQIIYIDTSLKRFPKCSGPMPLDRYDEQKIQFDDLLPLCYQPGFPGVMSVFKTRENLILIDVGDARSLTALMRKFPYKDEDHDYFDACSFASNFEADFSDPDVIAKPQYDSKGALADVDFFKNHVPVNGWICFDGSPEIIITNPANVFGEITKRTFPIKPTLIESLRHCNLPTFGKFVEEKMKIKSDVNAIVQKYALTSLRYTDDRARTYENSFKYPKE
jgi:hypothetical protein